MVAVFGIFVHNLRNLLAVSSNNVLVESQPSFPRQSRLALRLCNPMHLLQMNSHVSLLIEDSLAFRAWEFCKEA